jgi:hypothetical protein
LSAASHGADGSQPAQLPSVRPRVDPRARVVFALLVLACFAAFLITQRLKHTPTAVQDFEMTPSFSPYPAGGRQEAHISFKLEHAEAATVTIIDASGDTVATLVRDRPLARYKQFSLRWNGRRGLARRYRYALTPHGRTIVIPVNEGPLAPAGEYRVRVALSHHSPVLSTGNLTLEAR